MPELGESVTEGTVTRWLKQVGDQVAVDEPLLEVSTDKVDTEIPSPVAGTLLEIKANEDDTVEVGAVLAVIGEEGEEVPAAEEPEPEPKAEEKKEVPKPEPLPAERIEEQPPPARTDGRIKASPLARRLTEAWEAPAFQISMSADMTRAQELHERLRDQGVSVTDILTKLAAVALLRHREVNAHFAGDELRIFPSAHVGLAVATERGLIVPVQREVERKSLVQIAAERKELVQRTREGKLAQEDLEGGTFTISNLGMYGIEQFVAVLNPPQVAILAVGSIEDRAAVVKGEIAIVPTLTMTLTCDHRAIDGSEGAEFLRDVKAFVEAPALAL